MKGGKKREPWVSAQEGVSYGQGESARRTPLLLRGPSSSDPGSVHGWAQLHQVCQFRGPLHPDRPTPNICPQPGQSMSTPVHTRGLSTPGICSVHLWVGPCPLLASVPLGVCPCLNPLHQVFRARGLLHPGLPMPRACLQRHLSMPGVCPPPCPCPGLSTPTHLESTTPAPIETLLPGPLACPVCPVPGRPPPGQDHPHLPSAPRNTHTPTP